MPKLDEHAVGPNLVGRPLKVVERGALPHDIRRELKQNASELPDCPQRLECVEKRAENEGTKLGRRPVDASALVHRHPLAHLRRKLLELHGMARH